jgi:hypothetical protein
MSKEKFDDLTVGEMNVINAMIAYLEKRKETNQKTINLC